MSFCLIGGPSTFQVVMNKLSITQKVCYSILRCILIYNKSMEEHLMHLRQVFELVQQHQFYVKFSKCYFARHELEFLDHIVSAKCVRTDPTKVAIVQNWPVLQFVKELRSFLGMVGYYRKFVRHYGIMSKPLTNLPKKAVLFVWTYEANASFEAIKKALISAPILAFLDFSKPFTVESDASDKGIGAVPQQDGHPIAFISKALGLKNYEKVFNHL